MKKKLFGDEGLLTPYIFIIPHALFFFTFALYPVFKGLWISLHKWDVLSGERTFVGLKNYLDLLFVRNVPAQYYWEALWNTIQFVIYSVPFLVGVALVLALLVSSINKGRGFFRTIFFLPTAMTVSVVAVIWRWIFNYESGLLNYILYSLFKIKNIPWLTQQPGAWISIVVTTIWWTVGWNMVYFLIGLQNIPEELYEAAKIDGAGWWQSFRYITLPSLKPIALFIFITTIIASFNLFGQPQLMTGGGPGRSTVTVMLHIYNEGFGTNLRMGSASAMAYLTALIMIVITFLQVRLFTRSD